MHLKPDAHVAHPVKPVPPHCPHWAVVQEPPPELAVLVVAGAELALVEVAGVVVDVTSVVAGVLPPPPLQEKTAGPGMVYLLEVVME